MKKVIVVVGPTGVGKTNLGVYLAKNLNGEVISGDSIQIYRKMDIGSAKVTSQEKEDIVHHLIDICDISDQYSVKDFQEKSRVCIEEIIQKNAQPIIVGGTGLYIKAALYDYVFKEEQIDTAYLNSLEDKTNEELYALLKEVDEDSLKEIHLNNRKRIIRALNIAKQSSETKSQQIAKQQHKPIYDIFLIGLTMPRDLLHERINQRVYKMIDAGLEKEIKDLYEEDKDVFSYQSMQAIGYREWKPYFENEKSVEEVVTSIQAHSRQFAKRQYTWFNNQLNTNWYDILTEGYKEKILEDVKEWLND